MFKQNQCRNIICDEWLSEILRRDVYGVVVDNEFIESGGAKSIENIQTGSVFIYAKVPVVSLCRVRFFERLGFGLVDTNVLFEKQIVTMPDIVGNCTVRFAEPGDREQVAELAGTSFSYSRFHLDPLIPDEIANRIKSVWAENFFVGKRGEQMVVAVIDGKVAGFTQLLFGDNRTLIIDLIAVDEGQRNKGIAGDMISYAAENCRGFEKIRVGTQLANTASVRLYEKCGFRMVGASYIFHYHGAG